MQSTSKHTIWRALQDHHVAMRGLHLKKLFADDPARGARMTAEAAGVYFDYSKNRVSDETPKAGHTSGKPDCAAGRMQTRGYRVRIEVHLDEKNATLVHLRDIDLSVPASWGRQDLALILADQAAAEQLRFTEKSETQR